MKQERLVGLSTIFKQLNIARTMDKNKFVSTF